MSLSSQLAQFAERVATEFNTVRTEISQGGGGSSVTTSDTAPSSPSQGDQWFNSATGQMFVYYDSFWIEIISNTEAQDVAIENVTGLQSELDTKQDIPSSSLSGTILCFTAERNVGVTVGQHYAFGNGAATASMAVPANCKLVYATLATAYNASSNANLTVAIAVNNTVNNSYSVSASGTGGSGISNYYSNPLQLSAGDLIHFECTAESGAANETSVVTWYLLVD